MESNNLSRFAVHKNDTSFQPDNDDRFAGIDKIARADCVVDLILHHDLPRRAESCKNFCPGPRLRQQTGDYPLDIAFGSILLMAGKNKRIKGGKARKDIPGQDTITPTLKISDPHSMARRRKKYSPAALRVWVSNSNLTDPRLGRSIPKRPARKKKNPQNPKQAKGGEDKSSVKNQHHSRQQNDQLQPIGDLQRIGGEDDQEKACSGNKAGKAQPGIIELI